MTEMLSEPRQAKPLLVDVSTHTYGDSREKYVNVYEVAAVLPNTFDERHTTIILRSGKEVGSQHSVAEVIKLFMRAIHAAGGE